MQDLYLLTVLINIIKRLGVVDGKDTEKSLTSSHVLITHCTVQHSPDISTMLTQCSLTCSALDSMTQL